MVFNASMDLDSTLGAVTIVCALSGGVSRTRQRRPGYAKRCKLGLCHASKLDVFENVLEHLPRHPWKQKKRCCLLELG